MSSKSQKEKKHRTDQEPYSVPAKRVTRSQSALAEQTAGAQSIELQSDIKLTSAVARIVVEKVDSQNLSAQSAHNPHKIDIVDKPTSHTAKPQQKLPTSESQQLEPQEDQEIQSEQIPSTSSPTHSAQFFTPNQSIVDLSNTGTPRSDSPSSQSSNLTENSPHSKTPEFNEIEDNTIRLSQNNSPNISEDEENPNVPEMAITMKDVIKFNIPFYKGLENELDGFINTCQMYYTITPENLRATLLTIIKSKLTGDAYSKMQPLDSYENWQALQTGLKKKLKKPLSYEYAQEQVSSIFQKQDESIENFGSRARKLLIQLNDATRTVSEEQAELTAYRKTNEKLAISKFTQNLRNQNIKTLLAAANKTSLEECITFAMEKELSEKNSNIKTEPTTTATTTATVAPATKTCTFHKNSNHTEEECRRNQSTTPSPQNRQNTQTYTRNAPNSSTRNYRALQEITNYRPRPNYNTYQPRFTYNAPPRRQDIPTSQFQRLNLSEPYQNRRYNPTEQSQNTNRYSNRPYNSGQQGQNSYSRENQNAGPNTSGYNNTNNRNENQANSGTRNSEQTRQMRPVIREPSIESLDKILQKTKEEKN